MGNEARPNHPVPPLPDDYLERVDRAWDALEEGNIEEAGSDAEVLMDETEEHPEVRFLFGAALLESGLHSEALKHLEASKGLVDDPVMHHFYLASARFENLEVEAAADLYKSVIREEAAAAPPHYGLAQCYEFLGRYDEAEHAYEEAHRLEPETFPLPTRMKAAAFEKVVGEAVELLPEEITKHLDRVSIIVEPMPSRETLLSESEDQTISPGVFGLFVGPSFREFWELAHASVPPTVFIFQRNLERVCRTREELIQEIELTLYHELGHFLGLSEEELEERGLE